MPLVKPKAFTVQVNGEAQDLIPVLQATQVMEHPAWKAGYPIKRPGVYMFAMEPQPYWEPAEDCYIIHYTKTVVTAFGDDEGWDAEIGLKTEIVPLAKPYGLYAGNIFQGVVKLDGEPVPYAEVEVEYYNQDQSATAPTDYMVTQTVKADQNGVFGYAAPQGGVVGVCRLEHGRLHATSRRPGQGRGVGRGDLGAVRGMAGPIDDGFAKSSISALRGILIIAAYAKYASFFGICAPYLEHSTNPFNIDFLRVHESSARRRPDANRAGAAGRDRGLFPPGSR